MGLVFHEMMHHSFWLHDYDVNKEEEIITWAEYESYKVIKNFISQKECHQLINDAIQIKDEDFLNIQTKRLFLAGKTCIILSSLSARWQQTISMVELPQISIRVRTIAQIDTQM